MTDGVCNTCGEIDGVCMCTEPSGGGTGGVEGLVGDRGVYYGHPLDNHTCTAQLFSIWCRRRYGSSLPTFDWRDVCAFNTVQKLSRDANRFKLDNWQDIEGYARNAVMAHEEGERRSYRPPPPDDGW